MPIFDGRRSFLRIGFESGGAPTHALGSRHDEAAYMFGILTVKYNNSAVEVKEALVHVDKFITLFRADLTIRRWIRSVCYDAIFTLIRYENLGWGIGSFIRCRTSHNAILWSVKHAGVDGSTRCLCPRSRARTLEEMIGNHMVTSWMKSGVEQWI
jgi:hypothetical protein